MLVVDLELNQPSRKVIQIGSVLIEGDTIVEAYSTYVNPKEPIDAYIRKLTGIRNNHVLDAPSCEECVGILWEHAFKAGSMAAWGEDCDWLKDLAKEYQIDVPSDFPCYDLRILYRFLKGTSSKKKRRTGLQKALDAYGIQFQGRQHDALHDATMTAHLFLAMRSTPPISAL